MIAQIHQGRVILEVSPMNTMIRIPVRKRWTLIIPLTILAGIWGWAFIIFPFTDLLELSLSTIKAKHLAMIAFITVFALGGLFWALWMIHALLGEEIIIIENSQLTIDKKKVLFYPRKTYNISEIKNIRIGEIPPQDSLKWGNKYKIPSHHSEDHGVIIFDYDSQIVRFGTDLDVSEARQLIHLLLERSLLNKHNLERGTLPD